MADFRFGRGLRLRSQPEAVSPALSRIPQRSRYRVTRFLVQLSPRSVRIPARLRCG